MAVYSLFVPGQTAGANAVHFDLFNVAGGNLQVLSVVPVASGAAAVTGVVAVDIFLTRTTAVGTSGTAATYEGTSLTAMTITCQDGTQTLGAHYVTARLTPTGGATAAGVISWASVFTEETNAGTYVAYDNMVKLGIAINVPVGQGVRVVQGSVASVGVVGYNVTFTKSV